MRGVSVFVFTSLWCGGVLKRRSRALAFDARSTRQSAQQLVSIRVRIEARHGHSLRLALGGAVHTNTTHTQTHTHTRHARNATEQKPHPKAATPPIHPQTPTNRVRANKTEVSDKRRTQQKIQKNKTKQNGRPKREKDLRILDALACCCLWNFVCVCVGWLID